MYGREYSLRAHISQHDGTVGMKVKRCFSFSDQNTTVQVDIATVFCTAQCTVQLVDDRGCPEPSIMSQFQYDAASGTAQARLFSMFKFPDSNRVNN